MSRLRLCIGILLCVSWPWTISAQTTKTISIEQADSLVGYSLDGEDVRELSGNVRITQANVVILCDHALQYIASGKVVLTGNVVLHDDSMTIKTPRGAYFRDARHAEAYERVTLTTARLILKQTSVRMMSTRAWLSFTRVLSRVIQLPCSMRILCTMNGTPGACMRQGGCASSMTRMP